MTDKVQKIREEVVRMHNLLPVMDGGNISVNYADRICTTLEMYIDSLQEEPKFKAGQYLKQGDTIAKILEVSDDGYHCDNAFIPFSAQDQLELVKEPVSELLNTESMIESYKQRLISQANGVKNSPLISMCLTSYKHGINETLDTLKLSSVQRTVKDWKEPVSEDLEEAANEWNAKASFTPFYMTLDNKSNPNGVRQDYTTHAESFKAGAKWQEKQDQSTIELAEDHAMLAGMKKMKEEIMAKAVEVTVHIDAGGYPYTPEIELYDYDKDIPLAKEGDKYKVVLIKED